MGRELLWYVVIVLIAGALAACTPAEEKDEGSVIQAAGKRPTYEKVELAIKLTPDESYKVCCHSESQTTLTLEPGEENGAQQRSVTSSTATVDILKDVSTGDLDESGLLAQTSRVSSLTMEKVQTTAQETLRRTLIWDDEGVRVLVDGEEEPLAPEEQALVNALGGSFTGRVDERGHFRRTGSAWKRLAEAKSSPMFPYLDWDRLTELAMELPEGEVSVGEPWERTVKLPLGDDALEVRIVWRLKEIVGEDHEELTLFAAQVSGQVPEPLTFKGTEGGVRYTTEVEKMTIAGSYSLVFDLDKGNYLSVDGDLTMNMALLITTEAGGKKHQMRAIVDNSRMRITEETEYEVSPPGPEAEEPAKDIDDASGDGEE
ncbi:hypothetical protein J7J84_03180 [bacterium]|nr:hypothetical protein [bacterium]